MEEHVIMRIALPNNRGVTLVEVMISLVILLIVFMGLIQASLLSIDQNLRNLSRDEAGRVAAKYMASTKGKNFYTDASLADTASVCPGGGGAVPATICPTTNATPFCPPAPPDPDLPTVTVNIRNQALTFSVARSVGDLDPSIFTGLPQSKRIGICVYWKYRGDYQPSYIAYSVMQGRS
jgi:prepilin-type N-terminal cleavage/methylation domain-containing protein